MDAAAVLAGRKLVVRAARDHLRLQRGDRALVQHRSQRVGAHQIDIERQDVLGRGHVRADLRRQRLRAAAIDVGERQHCAVPRQQPRDAAADRADALHRDSHALHVARAQPALCRSLDAEIDAQRGERPRIAPGRAARDRQPGDVARLARDHLHPLHGHADILGGDVAPAERFDSAAERLELRFADRRAGRGGEHHALASAQCQPGHRVLVAHAARQAQRIGDRVAAVGIMPEARPAHRRAEHRGVNRDDRVQPRHLIGEQMNALMGVEIGETPVHRHRCSASCVIKTLRDVIKL